MTEVAVKSELTEDVKEAIDKLLDDANYSDDDEDDDIDLVTEDK